MSFQAFNVKASGRGKARADAAVFDSDEEELPAPQGAPPVVQTAAQLQARPDHPLWPLPLPPPPPLLPQTCSARCCLAGGWRSGGSRRQLGHGHTAVGCSAGGLAC